MFLLRPQVILASLCAAEFKCAALYFFDSVYKNAKATGDLYAKDMGAVKMRKEMFAKAIPGGRGGYK